MDKKTDSFNDIFARSMEKVGQTAPSAPQPAAKFPVQEVPVSAKPAAPAASPAPSSSDPAADIAEACGDLRNLVSRLALGEHTVADRALSILNRIEAAAGRRTQTA